MSIFEVLMLVCFGASWPFSIYRSYRARTTAGKSLPFLIILIIGYVCGVLNKLLYRYDNILYLYLLNMFMICIDTALWFRNRAIEKRAQEPV